MVEYSAATSTAAAHSSRGVVLVTHRGAAGGRLLHPPPLAVVGVIGSHTVDRRTVLAILRVIGERVSAARPADARLIPRVVIPAVLDNELVLRVEVGRSRGRERGEREAARRVHPAVAARIGGVP